MEKFKMEYDEGTFDKIVWDANLFGFLMRMCDENLEEIYTRYPNEPVKVIYRMHRFGMSDHPDPKKSGTVYIQYLGRTL